MNVTPTCFLSQAEIKAYADRSPDSRPTAGEPVRLNIAMETGQVTALIAELRALLERSPAWLRFLASEAFEHVHEGIELVTIDRDGDSAAPADDLRIVAKPADKLTLLVAALRAGNGELSEPIDFELHCSPPVVVVGSHSHSTGGRTPASAPANQEQTGGDA